MGGLCSTNGEKRNAYRLLAWKPQGKTPLGRPKRRWVNNIRLNLGEVGWREVDWICLAQDRNRLRALVNSVLNFRVPWNAGKLSIGLTSSGLSSSAQLHRESVTFTLQFLKVISSCRCFLLWARGNMVVKALCYKPEGRCFDTRSGEFLNLPNPSGRTRPRGLLSL
jgi:hypothetical protein